MTATAQDRTPIEAPADRSTALAERLLESLIATNELAAVWLGLELGLYAALRDGAATPGELAERAGIDERYAREWLEQQAVAGVLDVFAEPVAHDDPVKAGQGRMYALPAEHAVVLLDPEHPAAMAASTGFFRSLLDVLPRMPETFRTGAGVPYPEYGDACRYGIAGFNRPMFAGDLPGWLASAPAVAERLTRPGARVLDVGCGVGWSSIALAKAFPGATVTGVDLDDDSIAEARGNAVDAGVPDRVTFTVADAAQLKPEGGYDAAFAFETLHDMSHPVQALAAIRASLAEGASLIVAEEKVAETFTAPGDLVERLNYGFSYWHCLPAARMDADSEAAGTCVRPATMLSWARRAGFAEAEVLTVDHDFWRFYRLTG